MRTWLLTAVLAGLGSGLAAGLPDAQASLDKGDWKTAADTALTLNTAEGFTLAAKAYTLGATVSPQAQQEGMLTTAQGYARKALALSPSSPDANFELARADGRLAQFRGVLQSLSLAGEVKSALDKAIKADANYAGAYVALGLWNAELASKGFIATAATGASINSVVPNFQKAISLEPGVVTHRLEYANALIKLSTPSRNFRQTAAAQLQKALTLTPHNYWEQKDLDAARQLLATLK